MVTFCLISLLTYLKQASIYTTRPGKTIEQTQNPLQTIAVKNYGKWIDSVSNFWEHNGGLIGIVSLNANNFDMRLCLRSLNEEIGSTM